MSLLDDILSYNEQFVQKKQYEKYRTTRFPNKKMVIVTCMDTRLVELLPRAMNLKNGDAKIVKCAGAIVSHPFGSIMRSIIVAIYELNAEEVWVVGHHQCGMTELNSQSVLEKAKSRGISEDVIHTLENAGVDLSRWLRGVKDVASSVKSGVQIIKNHPLIPKDVPVHGLIMDPETGLLEVVVNGYTPT